MLLSFHPRPVNPLKLAYSHGMTPQDYTLETGVLRNSNKRYHSSNCDSGFGGQKPLVIQSYPGPLFPPISWTWIDYRQQGDYLSVHPLGLFWF